MLVLFDIDGTLLSSQDAGSRSMHEAGRELFGDAFTMDGVEIAGRIDPVIWADMAAANGIGDAGSQHERFRAVYARCLARRLADGHEVSVLPGVRDLLEALAAAGGATLGILTGNYRRTGRMKLEAAGLDPDGFPVSAWGCDATSRRQLPGLAMERHERVVGRRVEPGQVIVIGDTPHDVDCARAGGCRALAVASGVYARDALAAADPDLLVDDLTDTARLTGWILGSGP